MSLVSMLLMIEIGVFFICTLIIMVVRIDTRHRCKFDFIILNIGPSEYRLENC